MERSKYELGLRRAVIVPEEAGSPGEEEEEEIKVPNIYFFDFTSAGGLGGQIILQSLLGPLNDAPVFPNICQWMDYQPNDHVTIQKVT
jgi:hypothetical protein